MDTRKVSRPDQPDTTRTPLPPTSDQAAIANPIARTLDRWILPIYLVFFLLIYSPAILLTYGYADDYAMLALFEHGGPAVNDLLVATVGGGRPVLALLIDLYFSGARSMSDLQVMRGVGVLTIGALAWVFYQAFRRVGAPWPLATIAPVLICVTPPFQVYAGWAAVSFFPLATLLAGVAALLVDRLAGGDRKRAVGVFLAALALELLAISLYQPAAMMFWVFAAIFLLMREYTAPAFIRRTALFVVVGGAASGVDFLETRLLLSLGIHSYGLGRTGLATNPKAKLTWFVLHPFASALNVWSMQPSLALGVAVAAFSALGLALYVRGDWRLKAMKLAILVAFIPASYLPNLAVADMSGPFRTQVALMSLVVVCFCLACAGYVRVARRALKQARSQRIFERSVVGAGLVASLALGGLACYNVLSDIAIPEYTESAMIQSQLRGMNLASTSSIYVRMSCLSDSAAPIARFDEIGFPSSSFSWDAQWVVAVELQEINPAYASIPIVVETPEATFTVPAGSAEVDARRLSLYRNHQPWTYGALPPC